MTFLAAPLVAVLSLHASAFEVALVRAFESLGRCCSGWWPARGSTGCGAGRCC
jgi:hypothetical protein